MPEVTYRILYYTYTAYNRTQLSTSRSLFRGRNLFRYGEKNGVREYVKTYVFPMLLEVYLRDGAGGEEEEEGDVDMDGDKNKAEGIRRGKEERRMM